MHKKFSRAPAATLNVYAQDEIEQLTEDLYNKKACLFPFLCIIESIIGLEIVDKDISITKEGKSILKKADLKSKYQCKAVEEELAFKKHGNIISIKSRLQRAQELYKANDGYFSRLMDITSNKAKDITTEVSDKALSVTEKITDGISNMGSRVTSTAGSIEGLATIGSAGASAAISAVPALISLFINLDLIEKNKNGAQGVKYDSPDLYKVSQNLLSNLPQEVFFSYGDGSDGFVQFHNLCEYFSNPSKWKDSTKAIDIVNKRITPTVKDNNEKKEDVPNDFTIRKPIFVTLVHKLESEPDISFSKFKSARMYIRGYRLFYDTSIHSMRNKTYALNFCDEFEMCHRIPQNNVKSDDQKNIRRLMCRSDTTFIDNLGIAIGLPDYIEIKRDSHVVRIIANLGEGDNLEKWYTGLKCDDGEYHNLPLIKKGV